MYKASSKSNASAKCLESLLIHFSNFCLSEPRRDRRRRGKEGERAGAAVCVADLLSPLACGSPLISSHSPYASNLRSYSNTNGRTRGCAILLSALNADGADTHAIRSGPSGALATAASTTACAIACALSSVYQNWDMPKSSPISVDPSACAAARAALAAAVDSRCALRAARASGERRSRRSAERVGGEESSSAESAAGAAAGMGGASEGEGSAIAVAVAVRLRRCRRRVERRGVPAVQQAKSDCCSSSKTSAQCSHRPSPHYVRLDSRPPIRRRRCPALL